MKKVTLIIIQVILGFITVDAQTTKALTPVASLLFQDVKSKVSNDEKNVIARKLGFVVSGKKEQPFALDKDSKEYPFSAIVMPTDLNKDGKEEIFITYGNGYTSGNTGSSVALFIKNAAGVYEMNLGFPGITPDVMSTMNKGYPDLIVGGPGLEYPILRWNGKIYDHFKSINDSDYGKAKKTGVDQLSKEYQLTMK